MNKRNFILFVTYVVIVVTISYNYIFIQTIKSIKQEYKNELAKIASVASYIVCQNELQYLVDRKDNAPESAKEYDKIAKNLIFIKDLYSDIVTYIYVYIPYENQSVKFIIDADEDVSYFGTIYDASSFPEMLQAIDTDEIIIEKNISYDKEFDVYTISAYAPLHDKQGRQIATLGIDSGAQNYFSSIKKDGIMIAMLCIIIILLSISMPLAFLRLKEKASLYKKLAISKKIIKERKNAMKKLSKDI